MEATLDEGVTTPRLYIRAHKLHDPAALADAGPPAFLAKLRTPRQKARQRHLPRLHPIRTQNSPAHPVKPNCKPAQPSAIPFPFIH